MIMVEFLPRLLLLSYTPPIAAAYLSGDLGPKVLKVPKGKGSPRAKYPNSDRVI